jgi:hypothetical protein
MPKPARPRQGTFRTFNGDDWSFSPVTRDPLIPANAGTLAGSRSVSASLEDSEPPQASARVTAEDAKEA